MDEIQKYTEITTKRCRSIVALSADYRWGLSGTIFDEPAVSRFLGFIAILHIRDFPMTIPNLATIVGEDHFRGFGKYLVKRTSNTSFVKPKYTEQIIVHDLDENEARVYQASRAMLLELNARVKEAKKSDDITGQRMYSAYLLAIISYLRQSFICPMIPITSVYCDMIDFATRSELSQIAINHIEKIDVAAYMNSEESIFSSRFRAVLDKINSHPTERCVIFSSFRTVVDVLRYLIIQKTSRQTFSIVSASSIKARQTVISDFEKSNGGILILTYDIGAEGLNLQCASVVMLVDLWWNSAKMDQAIGRIYRPGQLSDVYVYFFISNTMLEKKIIEKNTVKAVILDQIQTGTSKIAVPKMKVADIVELVSKEDNFRDAASFRKLL